MPDPLIYVVQTVDAIASQPIGRLDRLRTEGFDVCVASPDLDGLDRVRAEGFRTIPLPGQDRRNVAAWLGAFFILQGNFLETRPSLVHGIGVPWAWIAGLAAHRADAYATIASVDSGPHEGLATLLKRLPDAVGGRIPGPGSAYAALGRWVDGYLVSHEEELRWLLERELVPSRKLDLLLDGNSAQLEEQILRVYDRILDEKLP